MSSRTRSPRSRAAVARRFRRSPLASPSINESPKTFTVDEANALLLQVKPLLEQLQGLQRSIAQTSQQLDERVRKVSAGNGYPIQTPPLLEQFQSTLKQLEELGCWLKDLNTGLIDFYGLRDGELIFLCWKLGEDHVRFWHSVEAGFAGRQPLETSSGS